MAPRLRQPDLGQTLDRAAVEDFAAVLSCGGPDVDDPVGAANNIHLVLDDEQRVPDRLEAVERPEQGFGVGGMQASGRLVHHIDDPKQVRDDLGGQPQRVAAQRAARKALIVTRMGDLALIFALGLLYAAYGTADIGEILAAAKVGQGGGLAVGGGAMLALAAVLKSAQFPLHGWLTEVMEAPTPVSALLHAGVINAGGFLLVRFADVMLLAPGILAALVILGGFTALFGSLVMLTQPAVKTSLAWSTVAQMGFMTLQCGLGLFPLALLHIVAHSLYKAHSFLASGGAVERIAAIRRPGPVATPGAGAVGRAFLVGLALYCLIGLAFGLTHKSPQIIALGAILIFGVAYMLAQGFADAAPAALTRRTAVYAVFTSAAYFALQMGATWLSSGVLPSAPTPGPLEWGLIGLAVTSFGLVAVVQAMFPLWAQHPAAAGLRVHLSNGFYANAVFDRLIGGWSARRAA